VNAVPVLTNDTVAPAGLGTRHVQAMNSYHFLAIPLAFHYSLAEPPLVAVWKQVNVCNDRSQL
jgi:hypothetical protein